jgi:hypothetical protein
MNERSSLNAASYSIFQAGFCPNRPARKSSLVRSEAGTCRRMPGEQQMAQLAAADQWPGELGGLQGDAGTGRHVAGVSGRVDWLGRDQPGVVNVDGRMPADGDSLAGFPFRWPPLRRGREAPGEREKRNFPSGSAVFR